MEIEEHSRSKAVVPGSLIRRFRPSDLNAFRLFWLGQGGERYASLKAEAFGRLVKGNPFSLTHDDYLVLEKEGRVVAYEGLMPFELSIRGAAVHALVYHDTMVDPALRGRGVGSAFVSSHLKRYPVFSLAVWMNAPNARVFEKCGWRPVEGIPTYARLYTLRGLLPARFSLAERPAGAGLALLYGLERLVRGNPGHRLAVYPVERFDDRADALFEGVKGSFCIIAHRGEKVLNWKFTDTPWSRFGRLVCTKGDEMLGYLVFKTRDAARGRRIATIYDFLCSPWRMDVFRALMYRAMDEIEKTGPDTLEVLCTDERFIRVLKGMGFVRARLNPGALKYAHEGPAGLPEGAAGAGGWFYTFGDGDRVFWDFD
ncbi:MAG: GNAT family N-acetyltransferase [Desulfomonilia bacterium]|jgi:GNAT superfamily N-acetyltransferase